MKIPKQNLNRSWLKHHYIPN